MKWTTSPFPKKYYRIHYGIKGLGQDFQLQTSPVGIDLVRTGLQVADGVKRPMLLKRIMLFHSIGNHGCSSLTSDPQSAIGCSQEPVPAPCLFYSDGLEYDV